MKQLLRFEEIKTSRIIKKFNVFSNHSGDFLGTIQWKSSWRCYVISYQECIDMSLSCNKELNDFIQILEDERKNNLGSNKKLLDGLGQ